MTTLTSRQTDVLTPLTRKDLYDLSERCRTYANELASLDQHKVSLRHCHEFNQWLPQLKSYDLLAPDLQHLKLARPIARWQLMIIVVILYLLLILALRSTQAQALRTYLLSAFPIVLFCLYLIPQRLYGTTIELVEAKVLYIVELLEKQLRSGALEFSEAAYHVTKSNLAEARKELRQQIDLAYRSRSGAGFWRQG